ncbi:hypothetical protein EJ05DRAFT_487527 [Pseudovirgaria hyperparasitica]|uniref:Uncharacterized protein n=1 Tax=Pseudovirgaria hyperparasitica TaxID=470096 RepID=A0A6A6W6G4_9PEZI|nr:uncharacterized protein EJ05DRAFT_487527 [Pseudovirgaria hyperparasitica]KAF2756661.1 hypothetical protein EJ05DRAFT_487527 [Pseudovirgaria hyperparasitica]
MLHVFASLQFYTATATTGHGMDGTRHESRRAPLYEGMTSAATVPLGTDEQRDDEIMRQRQYRQHRRRNKHPRGVKSMGHCPGSMLCTLTDAASPDSGLFKDRTVTSPPTTDTTDTTIRPTLRILSYYDTAAQTASGTPFNGSWPVWVWGNYGRSAAYGLPAFS